ncbi:MAG TPA: transcriptional activator domain-containing protein, partial [Microlunatus sp.]
DMAYGCLSNAAAAAACAGEYDRALELVDRCASVVLPNGLIQPAITIHTGRSALLRRLDRLSDARAACDIAAGLADRVGLTDLEGLVHHERGLIALAAGEPSAAATELGLALEQDAPVSRPLTRLLRAEALARAELADDAERELRRVALEPVTPTDFPATLVARMLFVEGLIARHRGDAVGAQRRFRQAADGWQRRAEIGSVGENYVTSFVDLGRPPISTLVEPERELARVRVELEWSVRDVVIRPAGA